MRKLMAAAVLFGLAAGSTAIAADLPVRKAPQQVIEQAFNWTGIYAGANIGYGWGGGDFGDVNGVIGGGQLGYNWQSGNIVFGVEVDGQLSDQKETVSAVGFTETDKINWLTTFRGRVGYAADRWLFYVTGGGGYGEFQADALFGNVPVRWKDSHLGWVAGAGVENALDRHWSWKVEYLYFDSGSFSTTLLGVLPAQFHVKNNIIRGGFNYRF